MNRPTFSTRLKVLLVSILVISFFGVYFQSYIKRFVGLTNAQGASPTPDINGSTYCENNAGVALTAPVTIWADEFAPTWNECFAWCEQNMSAEQPLCQWNGSADTCWVVYPPTEGGLNACNWIVGGPPPYGGYIGMNDVIVSSSPTPSNSIIPMPPTTSTPTARPDGTSYCENHGGVSKTAPTSIFDGSFSWQSCKTWCDANMTVDDPLCQWNGDIDTCWVNFPPAGGIENCNWIVDGDGAPPYGSYLGMSDYTPTPSPTAYPNGTSYCENHGAVVLTAPSSIFDSGVTWQTCKTWCDANMTVSEPICQWNGTIDTCFTLNPPAGGVETCNWIVDGDGAPPYGSYLGMSDYVEPTPTPTPTPTPPPDPGPTVTMTNYKSGTTIYTTTTDDVIIKGTATDDDGIDTVEMSQNGSTFSECIPNDGAFGDSPESFQCELAAPSSGSTTIEIRATDGQLNANPQANYATYTITHVSELPFTRAQWNLDNVDALADETGYHEYGQKQGNVTAADREGTGDAVHFDGSSSISIPDPNGVLSFDGDNESFTVDFWVKPGAAGSYRSLIAKTNGADTRWEIGIDVENQAYVAIYTTDRRALGEETPETQLTEGQWNHVIARFNSNDGVAIKVNSANEVYNGFSYKQPLAPATGPIKIGVNAIGDGSFTGDIDNVTITHFGDADAPFVAISPLANAERVTTSPTFTATITDQASNIASAEYLFYPGHAGSNLDAQDWHTITTPDDGAWDETSENITIAAPELTDGTWYLFVRATDVLGHKNLYNNNGYFANYGYTTRSNIAAYRFVMEVVDTTAPKIYAHAVIPMETTDPNPSVRGYVKDYKYENQGDSYTNITTVQYRLNGGEWTNISALDGSYDSPYEEFNVALGALSPGDYVLDIRAIDAAGNDTNDQSLDSDYRNYSESFTIIAPLTNVNVERIIREENFTTHDLQDVLFTNGIWGNGKARLKQTMEFTDTQRMYTNTDDFGFDFGDANVNVYPAADDNIWVALNTNDLVFFNTQTYTQTRYSHTTLQNGQIAGVKDFIYSGNRYVIVYYVGTYPTMIINTNNTPEDTSDDTILNLSDTSNINQYLYFRPFGIDTRGGGLAIYAALMDSNADPDNFIVRIDTKGTIMDFSDDTFTLWGRTQGIALTDGVNNYYQDFTALYFDQATNKFLIGSYNYGLFVCDDQGTLDNHADDVCYGHGSQPTSQSLFSIDKDSNGSYWLGGDYGIDRVDIHGTADQSDDTWQDVIDPADISNESVAHVKWVAGVDPVGDELFFFTRQGHVRALEYNSTYTDTLDDTAYDHRVPFIQYHAGGAVGFYMHDRNTIWIAAQARGVYETDITRGFDANNVLEFLPTPPQGILQINFITLNSVLGSVSSGSSHAFSDLVSYEVSNDDGLHWVPITIGQTVKFTTAGYKLKFRITMTKGSTPVISYVKLSYTAYPTTDIPPDPPSGGGDDGGTTITNTYPPACDQSLPGTKAPHIYAAIPQSSSSIKLYFADADGPMDKYVLVYGDTSGNYTMGALNIGGPGSRTYTVNELLPLRTYYFKMRAMNGCAPGPWSNEVSARTYLVTIGSDGTNTSTDASPSASELPPYSKGEQQIITPKSVGINPEYLAAQAQAARQTIKDTAALSLSAVVLLGSYLFQLLILGKKKTLGILSNALQTLGLMRKKDPQGIVYDTQTNRPVPFALLTIKSTGKTNGQNIQETVVTGTDGTYAGFRLVSGEFAITAAHEEYIFPTKYVRPVFLNIKQYYMGEKFTSSPKEQQLFLIPIDRRDATGSKQFKYTLQRMAEKANYVNLMMPVFVLSFVTTLIYPSITNMVTLGLHAVVLIRQFTHSLKKPNAFGYVKDEHNTPIAYAIVRVTRVKDNQLVAIVSTDKTGYYKLALPKDVYQIDVTKNGYMWQQSSLSMETLDLLKRTTQRYDMIMTQSK